MQSRTGDLVMQSRTGYVESGVITEVMVAVGSLACIPVRTRGAQTENQRSNRASRWSTTSARSTGQMSQRSSAPNGNVSPSLREPDGTRFDRLRPGWPIRASFHCPTGPTG